MQLRSSYLKKDVVKSEDIEKGNERDCGMKWPLCVERLRRLFSLEARSLREYVQSSQNHEGDG